MYRRDYKRFKDKSVTKREIDNLELSNKIYICIHDYYRYKKKTGAYHTFPLTLFPNAASRAKIIAKPRTRFPFPKLLLASDVDFASGLG